MASKELAFNAYSGALVALRYGSDANNESVCGSNETTAGDWPSASCACPCSTMDECKVLAGKTGCDAGAHDVPDGAADDGDAGVNPADICQDGVTLEEYCAVCASDWGKAWMTDCSAEVCDGTLMLESVTSGSGYTLYAGCGYVVRMYQSGSPTSYAYDVFDATTGKVVGVSRSTDVPYGHLCGGFWTTVGEWAPVSAMQECDTVAECKTIAGTVGCDAGITDAPCCS